MCSSGAPPVRSDQIAAIWVVAERAGYSLALGAFLLGTIVAETSHRHQVERTFAGMRDVFSAVFFVAIGMQIDVRELWGAAGLIVGVAMFTLVARPLAVSTGLTLIGTPLKDALRTGFTATPIGEFSFIIAQLGVTAAVVPARFYPMAVGISLVTALVAPVMTRRSEMIADVIVARQPQWLADWVRVYHGWLENLQQRRERNLLWQLSRKRLIQVSVGAFFVTGVVVFVERGQRKILVNYAKRQVGNKIYGGQSSHLPLKLNMAGVIPPIFASSIILFPATLAQWFGSSESLSWLKDLGSTLAPGQPIYVILYAAAIVFFCFFYTALVFNSKETADNLKKSGAFVPGIRPGDQTARYIDKILMRLTLAGAVYITLVCLLPEFLILKWNVPFYFGGTSLLIIVVVTMDFMSQVQAYIMSHQYESLLKKANFKGSRVPLK